MAFFDDLSKKAAKFTEEAVEKTGELADKGKVKVQILSKQSDIDDAYKELGKMYYNTIKTGTNVDPNELITKIDLLKNEIAQLENQ